MIPNSFQTGDAKSIPSNFGTGGGSAGSPTFTLGDGGNTLPATFSTGDSPFQNGSPGFSTEQPYVPGGTFVAGDEPDLTPAPASVDTPRIPEVEEENENEAEQE